MDQNQITNSLLTAIETVAQSVVDNVSYDKTITCTIVDDSLREKGQYIVTDGSARFSAYSENTSYRNNTIVFVTVPNGDFTQQKIITGKKTNDSTEPFAYVTPFDKFLPCTPNLIKETNSDYQLTANSDDEGFLTEKEIMCLEDVSKYYKNFDMLGVKADFQSWLQEEQIVSGDYGLRVEITHRQKDVNSANDYVDNDYKEEDISALTDIFSFQEDILKLNYQYPILITNENISIQELESYGIPMCVFNPNTNIYDKIPALYWPFFPSNIKTYLDLIDLESFELEVNVGDPGEGTDWSVNNTYGKIKLLFWTKFEKQESGIEYYSLQVNIINSEINYDYFRGYKISIDEEFDKSKQYFLKTPTVINVTKDDFETLRDNGELRKYNDLGELVTINKEDNGYTKGVTYYTKEYSPIYTVDQEDYSPNKYWIKDASGGYQLSSENGFTSGRQYYWRKKKEVKIQNFLNYTTEENDNKYYRIDETTRYKVFLYIKVENKENAEENPKYEYQNVVSDSPDGINPCVVYYEDVYVPVNVTKDNYIPDNFYYISEEKTDKGEIIEKVLEKDKSNGWKEGNENYYYEESFNEITLTADQYVPNKYYVLKKINEKDAKHILSTGNGYNPKTTYYSKEDTYTPVAVKSTEYVPNRYYIKNSNALKEYTNSFILSVKDMIGQPYSFSTYMNQQKTFNISELGNITALKIYFYQANDFNQNSEEGIIRLEPDKDIQTNNLFTKNIELYFGYDVSNIEEEYLQLFTYDPMNYQAVTNDIENLKKIYLKWVHKINDKTYMLDASNIDVFVKEQLDLVHEYLESPAAADEEIELPEYEMLLDESLSPVENRVYFSREFSKLTEEEKENIKDSDYDEKKPSLTLYGQIKFILNQSNDYSPERKYYQLGYWLKPEDKGANEETEEILTTSSYTDKLYSRVYTIVEPNEIYNSNIQYWLQVSPNELQELIPTEGFSFANTNQTYVKFTFEEDSNGQYIFGYRRVDVNENTSKDILYDYYYLDFSPTEAGSATYKVEYKEIAKEGYMPNTYYYVHIEPKDIYEIRWYRYQLGAPSADEYSGVHWTRIDKWKQSAGAGSEDAMMSDKPIGTHLVNDFVCELHPDAVYNKTEQIKAIVLINDEVYYSNTLTFENNSDVIDVPNVEQEHALRVLYTDETKGNYYLYDESNALIDNSKANELRSIKLLFDLDDYSSGSLLKNASKVTWIFPLTNTMINVNTSATNGEYTSDGTYGYIVDTAARETYELKYTIENYYGYTKNNNTITCNIEKDGVMYSTTAEMSFGQSGSNGTEYTLALDLLSADHVITWTPTPSDGESGELYYLTYQPFEGTNIDYSGNTIYYEQYTTGAQQIDMLHWHGNPKVLYNENNEIINASWNWDGGSLYYYLENENEEEVLKENYKVITLEEYITLNDEIKPTLYVKKSGEFVELDLTGWWDTYSETPYEEVSKIYTNSDQKGYREFNLQNYKDTITLYTRDKYEKIDINNPNHYSAYYIKENDKFVKVNIENAEQENIVVATLYDQNHNAIDISSYELNWNWLYEQNCLSIEKKDNTSIYLQTKESGNPENDACILEVTLSGFGDYNLTSYLPIPIRSHYGPVRFQGPTQIIYGASGTPNYYKDNINLYYNDEDGDPVSYPVNDNAIKIYCQNSNEKDKYAPTLAFEINDEGESFCRIVPMSLYVDGVKPFGIQCHYGGKWLWTQPILYIQNRYFSSTINQWDGNLKVDNDENTILAKMIGAGSKNPDGKFSGVIMGDWTDNLNADNEGVDGGSSMLKHTGLYGFHEGETSFGFMDDGTGFIGKSGNGRILFDGNESTITSGNWENGNRLGMFMDLDDGFLLLQNNNGDYIKLNSLASGGKYDSDNGTSFLDNELKARFPQDIPLSGMNSSNEANDSDYPFVVKGPNAFTAIGWSGNLLLQSKDGDAGRGISINSSAKTYPINVNDHYAVAWDGAMLISNKKISYNYPELTDDYVVGNLIKITEDAEKPTLLQTYSISGIVDYIDNRRNGLYPSGTNGAIQSNKEDYIEHSKNQYDYSRMNHDFKGLYASPLGDLYASKKIVVGENFAVNNIGHLRAINALFENCNANTFTVKYTKKEGRTAAFNDSSLSDIQYLEKHYGDYHYTPTIGEMGFLKGKTTTSNINSLYEEVNNLTEENFNSGIYYYIEDNKYVQADIYNEKLTYYQLKPVSTFNLGLETENDFGIKLNSSTNISLEARTSSLQTNPKDDEQNDNNLFTKYGEYKLPQVGGIYLTGRKAEINTKKEINLLSTFDESYEEQYKNALSDNQQEKYKPKQDCNINLKASNQINQEATKILLKYNPSFPAGTNEKASISIEGIQSKFDYSIEDGPSESVSTHGIIKMISEFGTTGAVQKGSILNHYDFIELSCGADNSLSTTAWSENDLLSLGTSYLRIGKVRAEIAGSHDSNTVNKVLLHSNNGEMKLSTNNQSINLIRYGTNEDKDVDEHNRKSKILMEDNRIFLAYGKNENISIGQKEGGGIVISSSSEVEISGTSEGEISGGKTLISTGSLKVTTPKEYQEGIYARFA